MSESHGTISEARPPADRMSSVGRPIGTTSGGEAAARLPASIRVGPFDFEIVRMHHLEASSRGEWGSCALHSFKINIQDSLPSATKAADTFTHEVNHAIWWMMGLEEADKQERIVGNMATGWTMVYRDNPWLLGWLADCLR